MPTQLDPGQVVKGAYYEPAQSIQVIGPGGGAVTITGTVTPSGTTNVNVQNTLVKVPYDEIDLTYVPSGNGAGQIATATYKMTSVTVATLTMTYNSLNQLTSVVKT